MKRDVDFARFTGLMAILAEGSKPFQQPSSERIEIYFRCLEDLPYAVVEKNALECLRKNTWFPAIAEIRQETEKDMELRANKDADMIEELCEHFLFPGFFETGIAIIQDKLEKRGRHDLIPIVKRWGAEIAGGNNPTATRAQLLKSVIADRAGVSDKPKELPERAAELVKMIGGKE